jgi:hypothetical protein
VVHFVFEQCLFVCSLFKGADSSSDYTASNCRMTANDKLERKCKEAVVACFNVLYKHFLGGTEGNYEIPQLEYQVFSPRFEPETSRIRSRSANYLITTFPACRFCSCKVLCAISRTRAFTFKIVPDNDVAT